MATASQRRASSASPTRAPAPGNTRFTPRRKEDLEALSQKYAQGGRDNFVEAEVNTFTPQKGDNWIRILPPSWEGAKHYGIHVYVHYGIGPDRLAYMCLEKNKNQLCPICEERSALAKQGLEDAANELRPTFRTAVWIVNRKEPEKGPLLWLMPYKIDQDIVAQMQDKRTGEVLWIDDPDSGYDVEFVRTGEKLHTQYSGVRISRNPTPLADESALKVSQEHPLPSVFIYSPAEVLQKAIAGTASSEPEGPETTSNATNEVAERAQASERTVAPRARGTAKSYTAEQVLDAALRAADTYSINIPDALKDPEVGPYIARELGAKVDDYPELVGL